MVKCWHCHQESSGAHYERVVENRTPLYGPWEGWRMSGPYLIAPGKAGRIMPARLLGILWAEKNRVQKKPASEPARVFALPTRQA
jgi:hypothetical protein